MATAVKASPPFIRRACMRTTTTTVKWLIFSTLKVFHLSFLVLFNITWAFINLITWRVHSDSRWRTFGRQVNTQTSLRKHAVGLIFLHQCLHLFGFEGRIQDLIESRVPLFDVEEISQLLNGEIRPAFGTTVCYNINKNINIQTNKQQKFRSSLSVRTHDLIHTVWHVIYYWLQSWPDLQSILCERSLYTQRYVGLKRGG